MTFAPCRLCRVGVTSRRLGTVFITTPDEPATPGHRIVLPCAHRESYFDLSETEIVDTSRALRLAADLLRADGATGFAIAWDVAITGSHKHAFCHLIPNAS